MGRTCARGKHEAAAGIARNQGLEFGRCGLCGCDLIRSRRQWRMVPQGFRVVWRSSAPMAADLDALQLWLDLPPIGRALALALAERPRPGRRNPILVALELALLGARGLASAIASRMDAWMGSRPAPSARTGPILRLAVAA